MRNTAENGFILVATLWFVALLAFAAAIIEGWISSSLDRGAALAERVAAHSALFSAEERVAFVMAAGSTSPRGIELTTRAGEVEPEGAAPPADARLPEGPFMALDDRPYRVGDVIVRLQDGAGLYDLDNVNRDTLGKLLKSYGITTSDAEKLVSALFEYAGKPADIRASGISDADYLRAGLPLPRHARLLTPWEPLRILGWERVAALWRRSSPFSEIGTLGPIGGLNINTASARMLTAQGGMDEREAARLVVARMAHPISDLHDGELGAEAVNHEDRPRALTPSNIVRLKLTAPGEPLMRVMEIRLTPMGKAPIRVDYAVDMPADAADRAAAGAAPLPELTTASQVPR